MRLLDAPAEPEPESIAAIELYGLGTRRTLEQWLEYGMINYTARLTSERFCNEPDPRQGFPLE